MYMKSGKQVELGSSRAWTSQVDGFAEWNFLPRRFNLIVSKVICLSRNNSIVMNSIWDLFVGSLRWYLIWLASEWKNTFLNKSFNCALGEVFKENISEREKKARNSSFNQANWFLCSMYERRVDGKSGKSHRRNLQDSADESKKKSFHHRECSNRFRKKWKRWNTEICATIKKATKKRKQSKFAQRGASTKGKRELKDLIKKPKSWFMACK